MKIVRSPVAMRREAAVARRRGIPIGLVPTMGCLHEGHLSLIRKARAACGLLVVSIFVNPKQFGPNEDFRRYPRSFRADAKLCSRSKVDILFHPSSSRMYGESHSTSVEETALSEPLCGAARPGHFKGVATIVAKLFNIVQPDVAVFGRKDYQQAQVIKRMVADLNFPVKIITAPIVREPDGLAMSSRNRYLSARERGQAVRLCEALRLAESMRRAGVTDTARIRDAVKRHIEGKADSGIVIDYIDIVDCRTLEPVTTIVSPALLAVAAYAGKTRLIDNAVLR